jgi:hypothetical protein
LGEQAIPEAAVIEKAVVHGASGGKVLLVRHWRAAGKVNYYVSLVGKCENLSEIAVPVMFQAPCHGWFLFPIWSPCFVWQSRG